MQLNNYLNYRDTLENTLQNQLTYHVSVKIRFTLASANLLNFYPELESSMHSKIFGQILYHQALSGLEQNFPGVVDSLNVIYKNEQVAEMLHKKPSVVCTFHSGSYRAINHYLLSRKICYSLVVSGRILREQGELFKENCKSFYPDMAASFSIIDAEAPGAAVSMYRALKRGNSLLVYVDGNTGAIENDVTKSAEIVMGAGKFYARTGFAAIADIASVPIIPAYCFRTSTDSIQLVFDEPLYFDAALPKEQAAISLTKEIYQKFFHLLYIYPGQWEGWLYLHQFIDLSFFVRRATDETLKSKEDIANMIAQYGDRFVPLQINENRYLFDKESYLSYPLQEDLFSYLYSNYNQGPVMANFKP